MMTREAAQARIVTPAGKLNQPQDIPHRKAGRLCHLADGPQRMFPLWERAKDDNHFATFHQNEGREHRLRRSPHAAEFGDMLAKSGPHLSEEPLMRQKTAPDRHRVDLFLCRIMRQLASFHRRNLVG